MTPPAITRFLSALLESHVYIPLRPGRREELPPELASGKGHLERFLTVLDDGRQLIPIFSQSAFAAVWAERELATEELAFKQLLWLVPEEAWLYLDPGQEVGKEISPWEIEQFRLGKEAIAEITADLAGGNAPQSISLDSNPDLFPELKKGLRDVLEVYREVKEGFLISASDEDLNSSVLIGLKNDQLENHRRDALQCEISDLGKAMLPAGFGIETVFDLGAPRNIRASMFQDAVPFYIAMQPLPRRRPLRALLDKWINRQKDL